MPRTPKSPDVAALAPTVVYPTTATWGGAIVAVYVRNSTPAQRGNFNAAFQVTDMVDYALGLGYAVRLYDEQGTSGKTLHGRALATLMVAHLRMGLVGGVVCGDLSRLTRDQTGYDAAEIGNAIVEHGNGLLVTAGKVWDLRVVVEWQMYQMLTMVSGWQWADIRQKTFTGLLKRMQGGPVYRGRPTLGYRREGAAWVKDERGAGVVAAVREELNLRRSLPDVCASLHARGIPSPWKLQGRSVIRPRTTAGWGWRGEILERMILDPIYFGEWRFGWSVPEAASVWRTLLPGQEVDVKAIRHPVPDLAYWTRGEALAWRRTFLEHRLRTRKRAHEHALLGVLVCRSCGEPLRKHGCSRAGLMYACRLYGKGGCAAPQLLSETAALGALRALLPVLLSDREAQAARTAAHAADRGPSVLELRLGGLRDKRAWIKAEILDPCRERGVRPPAEDRDEYLSMGQEEERLLALVESERDRHAVVARAEAEVSALRAGSALPAFLGKPTTVQGALFGLLVERVRVSDNGAHGRNRRHWIAEGDYAPLVTLSSDAAPWWSLLYFTRNEAGPVTSTQA